MNVHDHRGDEDFNRQKKAGLWPLFSCCLRRRVITSAPTQQAVKASASTAVASNSKNVRGASQTSANALAEFNDALCKLEIDVSMDARATTIASKAEEYLNHRLQGDFEETSLRDEQLALTCLAAQFAKEVYDRPKDAQSGYEYTDANPMDGTKAMICGLSELNTIILAIKGSKQVIDWAVNFNDKTDNPSEFLDGIHGCHSGFLETARSMVELAARNLENAFESRKTQSEQPVDLLFTGHSAGGAVVTLLYYHMKNSKSPESPLVKLKLKFRFIHCITFGAPPITTEPLMPNPEYSLDSPEVFIAFINEGDPVARADGPFVNSLIKLILSRRPSQISSAQPSSNSPLGDESMSEFFAEVSDGFIWKVPSPTYYNAGHLLVLKDMDPDGEEDRLGIIKVTREELEKTMFGDPFKHPMSLYQARIKKLMQGKSVEEIDAKTIDGVGTVTNESMQ